jgi:conjugative relaxase-like TrwC/TraI family protein
MLSIGTVSAGNQAQREYHERQLAEARDDYYRESEGPAGQWVGALAEQLGLAGEVTVEQFGRLLDGQHPATGVELDEAALGRRKTVAFDLAFSAPKSVSLLRMAGDEATSKAIDRAHDRAVRSALRYIEAEGWKGRELVDGQRKVVAGSGTVGVLYRHETTRNADPQLHSHAVLANLVIDEKGRARAITSPVLYRQAKTAGTVYQAVLRGELGRELGVEFDAPVNGLADLKGFDRGLIERWSSRRAEILEELARRGMAAGGGAAEVVALESRRAKDMALDHHVWRQEVRETLAREGFGLERAGQFVGAAAATERVPVSVGERLAAAPVERLTDQRATEDARPVRQAAMSVAEGYTAEEVDEALERVFTDERLVQVQDGEQARWTTSEHLQLEEHVRQIALQGAEGVGGPRVVAEGWTAPTRTPDGHPLSTEQQRVIAELVTSGRGLEVVRARAGAGKTTIAGLAKRELEASGMRVVGVAPTLQALAELDDVGLEVRDTLARCALDGGAHSEVMRTMDERTVVIVDEAAMAQTRQIAPLLERARQQGAKVIAIGDDAQLQAVGAGGWFRYLAEHERVPVLELSEVHRQRDDVERMRLNQVHRGDVAGWVRWAGQHDRIDVRATVQDAYTAASERYRAALGDVDGDVDRVVVMAPANAHRRELNEQLRRIVAETGVVDRGGEREFDGLLVAPGDRLVAQRTVRDPQTRRRVVENGERFEVLDVTATGARARAVAGGRRGELVTLPAGVLASRDRAGARAVEHAYARTVHKAQGMTVDRSILFAPEPGQLGRNLAYVGLTRTRDRADLVTVADDRAAGLARLTRAMSERRDHQAAIAFLDRDRMQPDRLGQMGERELDEHRHALLTETRQAMVRLGRLDREAREAWAGSRDARTRTALLAERDQLEAAIVDREQLIERTDPDGELARRGWMEQTLAQGLERDRHRLERIDAQLDARPAAGDVDAADEVQARIRGERADVERYARGLLDELHQVHGEQIDRAPAVGVATLEEHERPAAVLRQEADRRARVAGLDLAAAQQLGTGHPLVARWIDRQVPEPPKHQTPPRDPGRLTVLQRRLAVAIDAWRTAVEALSAAGGRERGDVLRDAVARQDRAATELTDARRRVEEHDEREPSTLRRGAHERWSTERQQLIEAATRAAEDLDRATRGLDEHGGRETAMAGLRDLEQHEATVREARRNALGAEKALERAGVAGAGEQRIRRLLGRRDTLTPSEQRRYDALAGRIAVADVTSQQTGTPRWATTASVALKRDVANWSSGRDVVARGDQGRGR